MRYIEVIDLTRPSPDHSHSEMQTHRSNARTTTDRTQVEVPLRRGLDYLSNGQSRGPKPAPRQCDWDLFVERKESTVNIETLLGFSRGIRVFTKECQAIVQEKKSFVLQDPTKDTWGTMVNKDLAKIFEKKGPQAYHWDKEIAAEPPNWTETILALRSDKFGLAQDEDGGNHYKGYVRAYRVILTEAEYRRLEGYCTSDIPTRSDLSCELEETKKMLKVITDTKLCTYSQLAYVALILTVCKAMKDLARLEPALIARIQEFNEIMKPELGSLFPKEALPPKRPFEYDRKYFGMELYHARLRGGLH